ncbi:MAG: PqqD family protein [Rhizobiales bacterium]|nr:PqqD family protein [Hyphomicrobiales bacterium]
MTDTFTIPVHVRAQQLEDQMVILDLRSGIYFGLNLVGSRIWELIKQGRTADEIAAVVVEEFDAPANEIEADVTALIGELVSRKLVEPL